MSEQDNFEKERLELERVKLELELEKLKLEKEQVKPNSGVPSKEENSAPYNQHTKVKCTKCSTILKITTKINNSSFLIACPQCHQKMRILQTSKFTFHPKLNIEFNRVVKYSLAAVFFFCLFKFCNSTDWNSKSNYSSPSNSSTDDIYSTDNSYTCPHCDGTGKRINQLSGTYGTCSSCSGTGKVNKYKHDHYVKEYSTPPLDNNSDYTYPCPRCGGLGNQTDFSGDGMSQTTCSLCQGKGKVNQWTYEHFDR